MERGSSDWQLQLEPEARSREVSKIVDTLKKILKVSGPEGLEELKIMAVRFENMVFYSAKSQVEYMRKISIKLLSMDIMTRGKGSVKALPTNSHVADCSCRIGCNGCSRPL